jgi:hypothetical protein
MYWRAIECGCAAEAIPRGLRGVSGVRELLDIVHETEELPMRVDFGAFAECEAREPLVPAQVAEHRLDRGETAAVPRAALRGIDPPLHARRVTLR